MSVAAVIGLLGYSLGGSYPRVASATSPSVISMNPGDVDQANCPTAISVDSQSPSALVFDCGTTTTTTAPSTTTTAPSTTTSTTPPRSVVAVDRIVKGFGTSAVTVAMTNSSSEVVVAFVSADAASAAQTVTVSDPGATNRLSWHLAGRANAQLGDAEIWWTITTGSNFSVLATPAQLGKNTELTVETFAGSAGIGAVQTKSVAKGAPSVTLTPQTTGSYLSAVGMDYDNSVARTLGGGQALDAEDTDSAGDTYWVQHAVSLGVAGQAVVMSDTAPTGDRFDITAVEVTPSSGTGPTTTTSTSTTSTSSTSTTSTSTTSTTSTSVPPSTTSTTVASGPAPIIDAATPPKVAITNNVNSVTSPVFSPPGGSVLYAVLSVDAYSGMPNQTVSSVTESSQPTVAWHLVGRENSNTSTVGGFVEVWDAPNSAGQTNLTVTATFAQPTKDVTPPVGMFQVLVVDNAALDQSTAPVTATADVGTPVLTASATVAAPANALVFAVLDCWNSVDNPPTAPAGQGTYSLVVNTSDVDTYALQALTAPTVSAGPVTMSATLSVADDWHMVAWVILPA